MMTSKSRAKADEAIANAKRKMNARFIVFVGEAVRLPMSRKRDANSVPLRIRLHPRNPRLINAYFPLAIRQGHLSKAQRWCGCRGHGFCRSTELPSRGRWERA